MSGRWEERRVRYDRLATGVRYDSNEDKDAASVLCPFGNEHIVEIDCIGLGKALCEVMVYFMLNCVSFSHCIPVRGVTMSLSVVYVFQSWLEHSECIFRLCFFNYEVVFKLIVSDENIKMRVRSYQIKSVPSMVVINLVGVELDREGNCPYFVVSKWPFEMRAVYEGFAKKDWGILFLLEFVRDRCGRFKPLGSRFSFCGGWEECGSNRADCDGGSDSECGE